MFFLSPNVWAVISLPNSWTLIAHATSEIVGTCPNQPMLMLSLFGVALTHGLYAESKTFLRSFLTGLFRSPRRGIPPPITHPMHPSYLVELCNEWTRLAPESCADHFTHQSFAGVTLEVLAEHGSPAVWTCKSITRLVQLLRTRDFECFLTFLRGLTETLATRPSCKYLVHGREEEDHHSLVTRLAKWTGVITTDFFCSFRGDVERHGVGDAHTRQFYSIVEVVASAYDAGLHLCTIGDDTSVRDPQASLVCAATYCLASPLLSNTSSPHRRALLALLRAVDDEPSSSTFDAVAHRPQAHLRTLAGALRAHDFGALECALWASAVGHSASSSSPSSRAALRAALADASAREQECLDMAMAVKERMSKAGAAPTRLTRSPPRKRARRTTQPPRRASQRQSSPSSSPSPSSSSTSTSEASTPSLSSGAPFSSSSSSVFSLTSFSGSPVPGAIAGISEDEDEDDGIIRGSQSRVVVRSSCANLKSVLADALRARKDLKAERRRASLRAGRSCGRSASSEREYSSCDEDAVTPALLSEGDVLDMFAYDDDPF
jgi:hypothetical protein